MTRGKHRVCSEIAIEWAGLAASVHQRARRLGEVIRFTRYIRAEDPSHELPPACFWQRKHRPRPVPYIFSRDDIQRLVQAASESGYRSLRRKTYSTLFALLACTGMRVSEAIRLRYEDITPDGLVIRCSKFRKSRLVPLHETAQAGIERYLEHRRPYAPFDDHVFISLRRKPLLSEDVETAFRTAVDKIGLPRGPGTAAPHATFASPHLCRESPGNLSGWPRSHHKAHVGAVDISWSRQGFRYLLVSGSGTRTDEKTSQSVAKASSREGGHDLQSLPISRPFFSNACPSNAVPATTPASPTPTHSNSSLNTPATVSKLRRPNCIWSNSMRR